jgi:hypothetical protein
MFKSGAVRKVIVERQRREDMLALALALRIRSEEYDSQSLSLEGNDSIRRVVRLVAASGEIC